MTDILLVLLIMFMATAPAMRRGEAVVPHPSWRGDIVALEVTRGDRGTNIWINQQPATQGELESRLAATYANHARSTLSVKGKERLSFSQMAKTVDLGHSARADQIGLTSPKPMVG